METFTWQDVPGWCDTFAEFYRRMVREARDGDRFVEVGTYRGRSAILMASEIKASGKRIEFDTIDSFGHPLFSQSSEKMVRHYLEICGVKDYVKVRVSDAVKAAADYADGSLALVFLDADHSRKGTADAIRAWLPKVRAGGVLAGDDYDVFQFPHVVEAVQQELPGFVLDGEGDVKRTFVYRLPAS